VQLGLKALLHAQLADVLGTAVVGGSSDSSMRLLLGLVDAPDVADHVAGQLAVGVVAEQAGLDIDAGEAEALRRKLCHFFVGQRVRMGSDSKLLDSSISFLKRRRSLA
jgi:hypothetical protein